MARSDAFAPGGSTNPALRWPPCPAAPRRTWTCGIGWRGIRRGAAATGAPGCSTASSNLRGWPRSTSPAGSSGGTGERAPGTRHVHANHSSVVCTVGVLLGVHASRRQLASKRRQCRMVAGRKGDGQR